MPTRGWLGLSIAAAAAACGVSSVPSYFPVPEDAENPIVLSYEGATVLDIVDIVAEVCSEVAIPLTQVVPAEGYVETRWIDIAQFDRGTLSEGYPARERSAIYVFRVSETKRSAGKLEIGGWYQPGRPPGTSPTRDSRYDRLLPTSHPGYQLSLELAWRLKLAMSAKGITVIEKGKEKAGRGRGAGAGGQQGDSR